MMAQYLPLSSFKTIYVVDLCASLCDQARKKVIDNKWNNVKVVEGDACTFAPTEGKATLVTFSYSLSSAPPSFDLPNHPRMTSCRPFGHRFCLRANPRNDLSVTQTT